MSRSRAILVLLFTTCSLVGVASAQDAPSRWRTGVQKPAADQPPVVERAEPSPAATIKWVGVGTPVTGGQGSFGLVELNGAAPAGGVTIQVSSSHPAIVVPATIQVEPGAADGGFAVETAPVAEPTTVTVSVRTSATAAPQTATVTVVPPSLSMVICDPQTVPAGAPTTCKVQLDGPVASPSLGAERDQLVSQLRRTGSGADRLALTIELASGNTAVVTVPPTVQIGAGQRSKSFTVTTKPLAQSASALVSASYGDVTKATTVYVRPVSLESVVCEGSCEAVGGLRVVKARVRLTAPAPAGGLVVNLSDDPNLVRFRASVLVSERTYADREVTAVRVEEGRDTKSFEIHPVAVGVDTRVTVSASAPLTGETRTLVVTIKGVSLQYIACGGGSQSTTTECEHLPQVSNANIMGNIKLTAPAPQGGLVVKLSDNPNLVQFWHLQPGEMVDEVRVPTGQTGASFQIRPRPVAVDTRVTISAYPPLGPARTAVLTIKAPTVQWLRLGSGPLSGVPVGGKKVRLEVQLTGEAPKNGLPLNFNYSGTTDITGPPLVKVPEYERYRAFEVTVGPCSVSAVCEVIASTGNRADTLIVTP